MRKRRAVIINKDLRLQMELSRFFAMRGYDTAVFGNPSICPVYDSEDCTGLHSCGDIMIMSLNVPSSGIDLITSQQIRGCKMPAVNKAIIAESLPDEGVGTALAALGIALFLTPLNLRKLEQWVAECEPRMNLEQPVAVRRREKRQQTHNETISYYMPGNRLARAVVLNKSTCGACFTTSHHLTTNDMIMLRLESPDASEDAVVRWVRPAQKNRYVVGISYCV